MRALISGVTGFLGQALAGRFHERGHEVFGAARRAPSLETRVALTSFIEFDLGRPPGLQAVPKVDAVIHCAHDFSEDGLRINLAGTQALYRAARAVGAERQLYLGSYSARAGSSVLYARIKYELETWFLERQAMVVRPGLVIGGGGMFGSTVRHALQSRVIPLADGGRDCVPIVGLQDFLDATERIVDLAQPGAYDLFNRELVAIRELMRMVDRAAGRRHLYVNMPSGAALALLRWTERRGIRLPVRAGSLQSLKDNQKIHRESDLEDLISRETPAEVSIAAAVRAAAERLP